MQVHNRINPPEKLKTRGFDPAERVGFEPTLPYGKRALQARALGQTMRPLQ